MLAIILAVVLGGVIDTPIPEAVFVNGKFWTGDTAKPEAQGVAVWRGRILHVGTNAEVEQLAQPKSKRIDLGGKRVVPGFYDSHVHFLGGGLSLARVELKDAKDEAEFGKRLTEFDQNTSSERWMLGGNWDHDRTFDGKLPTATTIDKYVKNRPVFLRRYDGHMALANTAALKLAGITAKTKDVPGGVIDRLPDGTPSGILRDNAMLLMDRIIPEPDEEEIAEAVDAAQSLAASLGVTSVQDMAGNGRRTHSRYLAVLRDRAQRGKLTCRIAVRWPIGGFQNIPALGAGPGEHDFLNVGGVKGFMDGSLGSSTAKFFEPYDSDAKTSGVFVTEPPTMRALVRSADGAGLNVAVHAIGDEANAALLDIFAEVGKERRGKGEPRFRIEHTQHLRPQDYSRFKPLGVIASMQPYHVIDDGRWAEGRIGKKRCASSYAYRSLLDNGATVAFGSDWPVAPLDPLPGIDAAVNRRTLDGKHPNGWFPEQRITVAEAVRAYTLGSAFGGFHENDRGTLSDGKLADFVVLSRDIFAEAERDHIGNTKVTLTVVGGKIVHRTP